MSELIRGQYRSTPAVYTDGMCPVPATDGAGRLEVSANRDGTVFASAERTATPTAVDIINPAGVGLVIVIDVTAASATPSVVFTIFGVTGGVEYTILASAAKTGTGQTVLRVHPLLTASANLIAKDVAPRTVRVKAVHADADPITYSVTYSFTQ
jgi:hypothetical protein